MSDRPSGVLILTVVLCGGLTALAIARVYNIYKSKPVMKEYVERIEWVQKKWGFQMPFTYPKTGPDPRGPVRRVATPRSV